MKQCSAPCVDRISSKEYRKDLENGVNLIKGRKKAEASLKLIEENMYKDAESEMFELAALKRDALKTLKPFLEQSYEQSVEFLDDKDLDVVSYYKGDKEVDVSIYMIRSGALLGQRNFHFAIVDSIDDIEQEISVLLMQHYTQGIEIAPSMILASLAKETNVVFAQALKSFMGEGFRLKVMSSSAKYASLLKMAKDHAQKSQLVRLENKDSVYSGLETLQQLLKLKSRPRVLECYDIAIWQGESPTASRIVFHDGVADKKQYRHYHLKKLPEGNNDFAMMQEVVERRIESGVLPDVFVVDGGKAQVNTVLKVLQSKGIPTPVVGIAKARGLTRGNFKDQHSSNSEERLVIPGRSNPFILKKSPALFKIIVQMRDEAHRFSRRLHHKAEKKRIIKSWVDEVKGLNEQVRKTLLQNLTLSKQELKELTYEELVGELKLEKRHASKLYQYLHAEQKS